MSRTLGSYLIGNTAEPLIRLGRWDEADELTARALAALPEGVFSATLHGLRAELAAMRGRYDEAARELRETRRIVGNTRDVQFTLPMRYTAAMIALGVGDIAAARPPCWTGCPDGAPEWGARYAWPLLWLGMRLEADDATRHRDRHEPVPAELTARCAALAQVAAGCRSCPPPGPRYRELIAAERSRADGQDTPATWQAAVSAWERAEDAYPLAYCRLRLAEALTAAGDLDAAGQRRVEVLRARRAASGPSRWPPRSAPSPAAPGCRCQTTASWPRPARSASGHGHCRGRGSRRGIGRQRGGDVPASRRTCPLRAHRP